MTDYTDQKKIPINWQPGDTILGTYQVEDVIITGGMGRIYITNHLNWKVKVAIKSPTEDMLSNKRLFARITKEANAWTNLGLHPHIAYCYFVRVIEEIPHLFVEYVDGGNLRDWIEEGKCADLKVVLDLTTQFCRGMAYAHSKGMIHRDIKPENILITKEGILKVTDFGIARLGKEDTSDFIGTRAYSQGSTFADASKTIGFIGTRSYASPEQFKDAHDVTEETDIFSFGVCLWEMLLGSRPYLIATNKIPLPDPQTLRPDLPAELASLLADMVAYELATRKTLNGFASPKDFFESLYQKLFTTPSPYSTLETLDLKAGGLNNRAISYLELEKEEEAVSSWEETLKEDSQYLEAIFNYGYYRWQNGAPYQDVLEAPMTNLRFSHEDDPDYWRYLAWLHYERGETEAIEKIQNSGHRINDPDFLEALDDPDRSIGRIVRIFKGHSGYVNSVAFSPDGRFVLSGSSDTTLRLWEVATGEELQRFEVHKGWVTSVAFSPDGRYVLSGSTYGTISLWVAATGEKLQRFEGHGEEVYSVAFPPDDRYVLSGSSDNSIRLWEVATGKEMWCYENDDEVCSVAFSPDGRYVLSGSRDKTIRLWEVITGKELQQFEGHNGSANSVAFSPDGRYVLSGSRDGTIRLWDVATGKELQRLERHTDWVNSVAFSPDGRYVLSGSRDGTIRLWEMGFSTKTAKGVHPYPALSRIRPPAEMLSDSRKARIFLTSATACFEKGFFQEAYLLLRQVQTISGYERNKEILDLINMYGLKGKGKRLNINTGWHTSIFQGHTNCVLSVTFSPNGRYVLSGSSDNSIRLWEVATGKEMWCYENDDEVCSVAFSPDGRYVLSGSTSTIGLWEALTGKDICCLEHYSAEVCSVVFSPDGRYVLSGSRDKTIRLWEVITGKEIWCFEGHSGYVNSVAFSPDGRYVISGSDDGTIKLWELDWEWEFPEIINNIVP